MASDTRILSTHVGSLVRPDELIAFLRQIDANDPAYDKDAHLECLRRSVHDVVAHQKEVGIDIVSDGEYGKTAWNYYVYERLGGIELRPHPPGEANFASVNDNPTDWTRFPEFYAEYFAVNDLPAEFYLETVDLVFQRQALAQGTLSWRGRRVDPRAIRRTALFTVEGERDDICAIGQTVAAHDLCTGLMPYLKTHHVQLGVGHYGVFSGRRWQQQIYPRLRELIHVSQ